MPSERTSRRGCDRWLDDLSAGEISTPLEFVIYLSTLVFRVRVSFVFFFSSFRYFIICSGSRESVQRRVVDPLRASGDAIEAREGQPFLGLYIKKKKKRTRHLSRTSSRGHRSIVDPRTRSASQRARSRSSRLSSKGKWHLNPSYNSSIAIPLLTWEGNGGEKGRVMNGRPRVREQSR